MKILLTAFEPFGGGTMNSSLEVLKEISREDITKVILPVTYAGCVEKLKEAIAENKPDFVVNLGMYGGSNSIHVEKIGINYTRGSIADNAGVMKEKGPVIPNGPDGIFTIAPAEEIVKNVKGNVPCVISLSAGGFICNSTYYAGLYLMKGKALFIHLPYIKEFGERYVPSFEKKDLAEEVNQILDCLSSGE